MPTEIETELLKKIMKDVVAAVDPDAAQVHFNNMEGAALGMDASADVGQLLACIGLELVIKSMSLAAMLGNACVEEGKGKYKDVILNLSDNIHVHSMRCVEAIETGETTSRSVIIGIKPDNA